MGHKEERPKLKASRVQLIMIKRSCTIQEKRS